MAGESLTWTETAPFPPQFVAVLDRQGAVLQHFGGGKAREYQRLIGLDWGSSALPDDAGRGPRKANGAGIAADPTLTDAWSCPGAGTWHPMFSLQSHPKTRLPVLSPALAPASGSTLQSTRSSAPGPKTLASVPGRPSTGGSAARPSVNGRGLKRLHRHQVRGPCCDASSASDRVGRARDGMTSRFRHRPTLFPAEAFATRVS